MSLEENKALVRAFLMKWNSEGRLPVELSAPGVTFQIGDTPAMDLEAFQHYLTRYLAAFPDSQTTVEEMVAEGDRVAFRTTVRATHTGEFMGIPASGKKIVVPAIGIARITDGTIAEWRNSPDRLSWMQQIGAVRMQMVGS